MGLAEKKHSTVKSLFLRTASSDRLLAEHVLAFADALREEGVALSEPVAGSVNLSTMACTGLSVRVVVREEEDPR